MKKIISKPYESEADFCSDNFITDTETKVEVKKETSNEIQTVFSNETIELIKNTVAPKTLTQKEFEMFIYQAKRTGLDPLSRQIYCIKSKDKVSIQSTIDGFRLIAERTGDYQGQTSVMWCDASGKWTDVWLGAGYPSAAKIGVYRKGFIEPLYAIAKFDTYAQRYQDGNLYFNWLKMPDLMIAKCAEALALRKAFPQELSNIYSTEEMANFTEDETPVKVTTEKVKPVVSAAAVNVLFLDKVINYLSTLKSKSEIEKAFETAKTRKEYSELSEVEKQNFDEKYLEVIAKFITTDNIVPFDIPAEDVKTVKKEDPEMPEISEMKTCKNVTDLNKVYKKITSVPTYKQYSGEYQQEIDATFESVKEQIKKGVSK